MEKKNKTHVPEYRWLWCACGQIRHTPRGVPADSEENTSSKNADTGAGFLSSLETVTCEDFHAFGVEKEEVHDVPISTLSTPHQFLHEFLWRIFIIAINTWSHISTTLNEANPCLWGDTQRLLIASQRVCNQRGEVWWTKAKILNDNGGGA
ncbi:uncharacterized protein [Physcomitrium patens]|uniref:uncharacterized protein n=1 Tax=Physcomitrium patens TaxID=3218 RepID=UPI003CCDD26C